MSRVVTSDPVDNGGAISKRCQGDLAGLLAAIQGSSSIGGRQGNLATPDGSGRVFGRRVPQIESGDFLSSAFSAQNALPASRLNQLPGLADRQAGNDGRRSRIQGSQNRRGGSKNVDHHDKLIGELTRRNKPWQQVDEYMHAEPCQQ
jgi:hypothetical protein